MVRIYTLHDLSENNFGGAGRPISQPCHSPVIFYASTYSATSHLVVIPDGFRVGLMLAFMYLRQTPLCLLIRSYQLRQIHQ